MCKPSVPTRDIVYTYCSVITSVLEYAGPIWHDAFTSKLSTDIERLQKRCLRIFFIHFSYSKALDKPGFSRLDSSLAQFTKEIFREIKDPTHSLHYLIPPPEVSISQTILRSTFPYLIANCKNTGYGKDFLQYWIGKKY